MLEEIESDIAIPQRFLSIYKRLLRSARNGKLLFLLRFHFFLMYFDALRRNLGRHDIVMIEVHREVAASAGDRAELGSVAGHFCPG